MSMRPAAARCIGSSICRGSRWRGMQAFIYPQWAPVERRACASSAVAAQPSFIDQVAASFRTQKPNRQLIRVLAPAQLLADPDTGSEVVAEVSAGELLEAFADLDSEASWMLVRCPLDSKAEAMGNKTLNYQDGWLLRDISCPPLELAEFQLGDNVAAKLDLPHHPMIQIMRMMPPWATYPIAWLPFLPRWTEKEIPKWVAPWLAEIYAGKIGGVLQGGKFLVQRPSGAMPERMASEVPGLFAPRAWRKRSAKAGMVGFLLALIGGTALHLLAYATGSSYERGVKAIPKLIGWYTIMTIIITPFAIIPTMIFTTSQAGATSIVWFINMLLYLDFFTE